MSSPANNGKGSAPSQAGTIYQLLKSQAERNSHAVAIESLDRPALTYGDLLCQAQDTVKTLRALHVNRNDRVAIVLPNGPEMASAFISVACGATCAPLNPGYRAEEFDFYLSDLKARALIIASDMDSPAREVARKRQVPIIELAPLAQAGAGRFRLIGDLDRKENRGEIEASFAESSDIALVLHTSGTTSRPKIVPLTQTNICSSGRNVMRTLALTEKDRCLNVMPLFHIHGLIAAVVTSVTAGATVICTPGLDPEKFFGWLDRFRPTWYTAVPTMHQAVLALARVAANRDIISRCALRFIRSSSASLPQPVMEELESAFQTQVIEAYGMTEASHQMTSNPLPPLSRKPGSVGLAAGPEVSVMDESGRLLPAGEIGEVVIRGTNVTVGYENNPIANQSAFTNGWFRTGDQGRFDTDGYLFLTGRLKEIINRGGEKVAPREVDDVLTQHPAVAQAVTFAVPHPTLGEDIAAAVVARKGSRLTPGEIRDFAASRLVNFKVPKQVLVLDEIPKGPTGKLQRIGLADKLAEKLALAAKDSFVGAQTPTQKQLVEVWKNLLRLEQVGVHDDFHAVGGDSLAMATLMIEVETRFGKEVPIDAFLRNPTIETLADLIEHKKSSSAASAVQQKSATKPIRDSVVAGLKNRLFQYVALYIPGYKTTRVWLHRRRGVAIGSNVSIGLSAIIETAYPKLVSIGNNVTIGMRALIIGHLRDSTTEARANHRPTVRIEDDVYIGPGVIILPNVTIGRGAVVSAGTVVSRSVPPHTLVQGNPAIAIARCGVSLGGGVSYEEFLRHLMPLQEASTPSGVSARAASR